MTISWSCSISQFWICLWTFVLSLYGLGFLRFSIIVFSLWVSDFDEAFELKAQLYFGILTGSFPEVMENVTLVIVALLCVLCSCERSTWNILESGLVFFIISFFMGFMLSGLGTICMIKLIWQTFIHVEFSYLWIGFAFIGLFMSFSVYFGWIIFGIPLDPLSVVKHFQISKEFAFHSFFFLVFMWLA